MINLCKVGSSPLSLEDALLQENEGPKSLAYVPCPHPMPHTHVHAHTPLHKTLYTRVRTHHYTHTHTLYTGAHTTPYTCMLTHHSSHTCVHTHHSSHLCVHTHYYTHAHTTHTTIHMHAPVCTNHYSCRCTHTPLYTHGHAHAHTPAPGVAGLWEETHPESGDGCPGSSRADGGAGCPGQGQDQDSGLRALGDSHVGTLWVDTRRAGPPVTSRAT